MGLVLCIDGPSGAGKGTISRLVANRLGFEYLDSGALYRVLAVVAEKKGIPLDDEAGLARLAKAVKVSFAGDSVIFEENDISSSIRTEETGGKASQLAVLPEVRKGLLDRQRAFANSAGLVADGRDMGTVVFPTADLKIYLTATAEERASRRYLQLKQKDQNQDADLDANQLIHKESSDSLRALVDEIKARDERDANRTASPLHPAPDAIEIDSTSMTIEEVVNEVVNMWLQRS